MLSSMFTPKKYMETNKKRKPYQSFPPTTKNIVKSKDKIKTVLLSNNINNNNDNTVIIMRMMKINSKTVP